MRKERMDEIPEEPVKPDLVEMTPEGFEKFLEQFKVPPASLIFVCAWHDPSTWPRLEEGQHYTHGICARHHNEIVEKYKKGGEKNE